MGSPQGGVQLREGKSEVVQGECWRALGIHQDNHCNYTRNWECCVFLEMVIYLVNCRATASPWSIL